ncbi:voltage-dependent T-type calcium channel subunit alpha-1G [Platysternon megacephalum]|uniref:Voltage-dependent T-type calcium channel subunit alpha-1G n=1 Tax=Platysternon megacephalum TaxID=55544 RepID=A0A4D9E5T9_9SAUR|nr:voltage-dependent T-type calcium channel subunit alpha-1G [Platysternon megacephalum]
MIPGLINTPKRLHLRNKHLAKALQQGMIFEAVFITYLILNWQEPLLEVLQFSFIEKLHNSSGIEGTKVNTRTLNSPTKNHRQEPRATAQELAVRNSSAKDRIWNDVDSCRSGVQLKRHRRDLGAKEQQNWQNWSRTKSNTVARSRSWMHYKCKSVYFMFVGNGVYV